MSPAQPDHDTDHDRRNRLIMHRILQRQLRKLGLTEKAPPKDAAEWQAFLQRVGTTYQQSDDGIYTLKRSGQIADSELTLLNEQLNKLASFPEDNIGPVMRFGSDKTLIYANPAAQKILHNLEVDENDKAVGELARFIENVLDNNNIVTHELEIENSIFLIRFVSIPGNNCVNVYGTDITVQKNFEKKLIASKDLAVQSSRAKSEFLAMMSHEIRTPMNGVMGMSELLLNTPLKGKQQRYANNIIKSAHTLLRIIDDILDISKIDAGRLDLESVEFNLTDFIHEFSEFFLVRLTEKQLILNINITSDVPQSIRGDATRLRQILINLIGNAIKFTETGEILLNASLAKQDDETTTLLFEIIDEGIGINESMRAHIFESFTQADQSTTRLYGGTGLGLAIVERLVHMMNGEVGVDSKPGKGSRFWFTVQLQQSYIKAGDPDSLTDETACDTGLQKSNANRILLAEDNTLNQEVATEMLEMLGYQVDVVDDGQQAVQAVKNNKYSLIFMDCQMPGMDGYEATRQIRQLERDVKSRCPIPIVALTANAMTTDSKKCKLAGMDDFLSKPFTLNGLETIIDNCLQQDENNKRRIA